MAKTSIFNGGFNILFLVLVLIRVGVVKICLTNTTTNGGFFRTMSNIYDEFFCKVV